ncbi:MAG: type II toxin-antitoxin system RelE/ParE family toxin [Lachnospiraceae bacterium]|nr:type II toxin-antitoxin system RelE/ParE family toxin [Lachnospiraceae bacterium]
MADKYTLRYLPLFYDDLEEQVAYISDVLLNPSAANDLLDSVEKAILDRLPNAESYEKYHSRKERKYPYYRIYVKEYTIYYVVIPAGHGKKIMEVRRILHNLQDRDQYI